MNPDNETLSKENRILNAMKKTLTEVIKDTATPPKLKHPLSENTRLLLRECLELIAIREYEITQNLGIENTNRPHYTDSLKAQSQTIFIDQINKQKK